MPGVVAAPGPQASRVAESSPVDFSQRLAAGHRLIRVELTTTRLIDLRQQLPAATSHSQPPEPFEHVGWKPPQTSCHCLEAPIMGHVDRPHRTRTS